jgi:hypothetical protein
MLIYEISILPPGLKYVTLSESKEMKHTCVCLDEDNASYTNKIWEDFSFFAPQHLHTHCCSAPLSKKYVLGML